MTRTLFALFVLPGCLITRGNGVPAEEFREVGTFSELRATTQIDVAISVGPDADGTVLLRCDENLMHLITTEVRGEALVLRTSPGQNIVPRTACELEVSTDWLAAVDATGSGNVYASGDLTDFGAAQATGSGDIVLEGIDSSEVDLESTGSGKVTASGIADCGTFTTTGSGGIEARDLVVACASATTTGSGSIELTATETADVTITGSGDVVVWGGASVRVQDTGSGNLDQR